MKGRTDSKTHRRRLLRAAREYKKLGYEVIVEPGGKEVPSFLRGFRPDLIAKSENDNVIVEVKTRVSLRQDSQISELSQIIQKKPSWRFELVITNPKYRSDKIGGGSVPDLCTVETRLHKSKNLFAQSEYEASIMMAKLALEGAILLAAEAATAMPSKQHSIRFFIKWFYDRGLISKATSVEFSSILRLFNSVSHGYQVETPSERDMQSTWKSIEDIIHLKQLT